MQIELKNIYHSDRLSEETIAFTASLYINGMNAGIAKNEGRGGPTMYHSINEMGAQLIKQAEIFCKQMPAKVIEAEYLKEKQLIIEMNLEAYIDDLLIDFIGKKDLQKFNRKLKKEMLNGIVFGIPGKEYRLLKLAAPLEMIIKNEPALERLREIIQNRILPVLKQEEKILNTNIPQECIDYLGIGGDKIVSQQANVTQLKRAGSKKRIIDVGSLKRKRK